MQPTNKVQAGSSYYRKNNDDNENKGRITVKFHIAK